MTTTPSCSIAWDLADLPAWGTAKVTRTIVAVEAAGAWGRDAVADAGFTAPKDAALYAVRRPGRHATSPTERHVIVSGGFDAEPWLVEGRLTPEQIKAFVAADVCDETAWERFGLQRSDASVLLVCTNGRRDVCCAVRARPVALAAAAAAPGQVWEVSHIGGHRFAPTAIHLPSGQTFGRLTDADAVTLATADMTDVVGPRLFSAALHRGRVDLAPTAQVAETWWRQQHPDLPLSPVLGIGTPVRTVEGDIVALPDGSQLLVAATAGPPLPDSCVKPAQPSSPFTVVGGTRPAH